MNEDNIQTTKGTKVWYESLKKDKNIKLGIASIGFSFVFSILLHLMLEDNLIQDGNINKEKFISLFFFMTILSFLFSKLLDIILSKNFVEEKIEETLEKISIEKHVNEILNSNEFISALRTTLPKGEKDNRYGLDHIPFLLQNSNEKRERYNFMSNFFLSATIIMAIISIVIVTYFGYILINDDSVGFYKALTSLEETVKQMGDNYDHLIKTDTMYLKDIKNDIKAIANNSDSANLKTKLLHIIDTLNLTNIQYANNALNEVIDLVSDSNYVNAVEKSRDIKKTTKLVIQEIQTRIKNISIKYVYFAAEINKNLSSIKSLESNLKELNIPDSYKLSEIFKRLFIGIMVTSFLFAILKFLINQYKSNYEKTLNADEENSLIRRFYVAYKASQNDDERLIVITKLVDMQTSKESFKESEIKAFDNDMIKEILSAIAKKI